MIAFPSQMEPFTERDVKLECKLAAATKLSLLVLVALYVNCAAQTTSGSNVDKHKVVALSQLESFPCSCF